MTFKTFIKLCLFCVLIWCGLALKILVSFIHVPLHILWGLQDIKLFFVLLCCVVLVSFVWLVGFVCFCFVVIFSWYVSPVRKKFCKTAGYNISELMTSSDAYCFRGLCLERRQGTLAQDSISNFSQWLQSEPLNNRQLTRLTSTSKAQMSVPVSNHKTIQE